MKKWFFCLIFIVGCATPQNKWWDHPVEYFGAGYAFVGSAQERDSEMAKEAAYAKALKGLVAFLNTQIESMAEDISKESNQKSELMSKENLREFVQAHISAPTATKVEKDPETNTTYCLIMVSDPSKLLRAYGQVIQAKMPTAKDAVEKLIQREEKRIIQDRNKFLKEVRK